MARAREAAARADLVLWLGAESAGPERAWEIDAQADRADAPRKHKPRHRLSVVTGEGMPALRADLIATARHAMPQPGAAGLNARQHDFLTLAAGALAQGMELDDPLLVAEELRRARMAFDSLLGRTTTEDMLDTLFGRFCIGK